MSLYGQDFPKSDSIQLQQIEKTIVACKEYQSIPGLAVGIVKNNEIVYAKGFGVKDLLTKEKVDINTVFHLASISKTFTSASIIKLSSEGKLKLSDKLVKYIPNLVCEDTNVVNITINHLLTHISGIRGDEDLYFNNLKYVDKPVTDFVSNLHVGTHTKPGEKFWYSNLGYKMLGAIIEKVSGMPFETYIKKEFFLPLGMTNSTFTKRDFEDKVYCSPYIFNYDSCKISRTSLYPYSRINSSSGNLESTVSDMCKYAIFHLNAGKTNEKAIIPDSAYKKMWKGQAKVEWGGIYELYGTGWFVGNYKKNMIVHHSGNDHGFRAIFLLLPVQKIGIVILSNYEQSRVLRLGEELCGIMLGKPENKEWKDNMEEVAGTYCKDKDCVTVYSENQNIFMDFKGHTYCLVPSAFDGLYSGSFIAGRPKQIYYDQANIMLEKNVVRNEEIYTLKINGVELEKVLPR